MPMPRPVTRADAAGPAVPADRFCPVLGVDVPAGTPLRWSPLRGAFGVEGRGIAWGRPGDEVIRQVEVALRRHLLVVLRGQPSPSEDQLDEFLGAFGRLVLDTEDGRAHYAGHRNLGGPASGLAREMAAYQHRRLDNRGSTYYDPADQGASELVWHNDQSHRPMRKVLSVLEAEEFEDGAVPTEFRDTYTAYETLPSPLRVELEHRQVVYFDPRLPPPAELPRTADAMHPVFMAHPHTSRRALYVNHYSDRIAGMDRADSDRALGRLRAHLQTHAPRYCHRWRTGDLVLWDNIGVQHRRDPVPPGQRRRLRQHGGVAE